MDIKELSSWGLSKAIYDVIENGFTFNEETGEIFFTSDDLDALEEAFDSKLNGIAGFISRTEANIENLKQRKKDIDNNIKYYEARIERLKNYLKSLMETNNIDKKELDDFRLGFRKSKSVEINDEDAVMNFMEDHPEYSKTCIKEEVKRSVVKTGLKELITDGVNIPGASVVENKNLVIK